MNTSIAEMERTTLVPMKSQIVTPPMLVGIALDKGADIEKLERLMQMAMAWEANEARKDFHLALSGFKSQALAIRKDKTVSYKGRDGKPDTEFRHATLGNVVSTITPELGKYQLSHSWDVRRDGDRVFVTCKLTHASGHSESVTIDGPLDTSGSKNNIQSVGSTITYLERYTLLAITGLATSDQDNDGASGIDTGAAYISAEQLAELRKQADAAAVDMAKFLHYFGVEDLPLLPAKRYTEALMAIKAKAKAAKGKGNA